MYLLFLIYICEHTVIMLIDDLVQLQLHSPQKCICD